VETSCLDNSAHDDFACLVGQAIGIPAESKIDEKQDQALTRTLRTGRLWKAMAKNARRPHLWTCACIFFPMIVTLQAIVSQSEPLPPPASANVSPSPLSSHPPSGPTTDLSLDQRIQFLEKRIDLALSLKDEQIKSINDRSESLYKLLQFIAVIAAVLLGVFSIRDIIVRWRDGTRRKSIDEIVMELMNLQKTAAQQQLDFGMIRLKETESTLKQQVESVKNVNDVIEVVRRTLQFRLDQEEIVAKTIAEIERMNEKDKKVKGQKLATAISILDHFKTMSRMEFASLTEEQQKRGVRLQRLVNELEEFLGGEDSQIVTSLLYTCGVVAYYDNDVIEAKSYLDRAAKTRARDHDGELETNQDYRQRFGLIHYFRALIQKNWGELSEAQYEIDQSEKLLKGNQGELLTPVTKAEILSYIKGQEEDCRTQLSNLLQKTENLEAALKKENKDLNPNQVRLRNRMLGLYGNTYFVQHKFAEALAQYTKAIGFSSSDYFALASAAQCERALKNEEAASRHFRICLEAIEHSGDFRRKRERLTRAVIATTAAIAARGCHDPEREEEYSREARNLLIGNLSVDGMLPKFFSPSTKRLVSAAELLKELD
jgi:tetratricopeptide (TPR) repeat protein